MFLYQTQQDLMKQQMQQYSFKSIVAIDDHAFRQIRKRSLFDDENLTYAFLVIYDHLSMVGGFDKITEIMGDLHRRLRYIYYNEHGEERSHKLRYFLNKNRDYVLFLVNKYNMETLGNVGMDSGTHGPAQDLKLQ